MRRSLPARMSRLRGRGRMIVRDPRPCLCGWRPRGSRPPKSPSIGWNTTVSSRCWRSGTTDVSEAAGTCWGGDFWYTELPGGAIQNKCCGSSTHHRGPMTDRARSIRTYGSLPRVNMRGHQSGAHNPRRGATDSSQTRQIVARSSRSSTISRERSATAFGSLSASISALPRTTSSIPCRINRRQAPACNRSCCRIPQPTCVS